MAKVILKEANTKKEITLKEGDVIVYDDDDIQGVTLWRPREGFPAERLEVYGDEKFYFRLLLPHSLIDIVRLMSACTGLSFKKTNELPFEKTKACRYQQPAFRFTNSQ